MQLLKDPCHRKRSGIEIGQSIDVKLDNKLTMNKKMFLNNVKNKQQFINLTGNALEKAGLIVKRAEGDADLLIAVTACISSMLKPTCAVTEDTDNLALLLHYSEPLAEPLYMSSANRTISINTMKLLPPPPIVNILLFLHLQSGCDTTSRPKGIGKLTALSKAGQL